MQVHAPQDNDWHERNRTHYQHRGPARTAHWRRIRRAWTSTRSPVLRALCVCSSVAGVHTRTAAGREHTRGTDDVLLLLLLPSRGMID